jgi:hypothetical protein
MEREDCGKLTETLREPYTSYSNVCAGGIGFVAKSEQLHSALFIVVRVCEAR